MAGTAADNKSSLRTASFPYYVDTAKSKKPSLPSNLSNSNSTNNINSSTLADLRRVGSYNVQAPTRGVFGSDVDILKNIESPRAARDLAGAGSISRSETALIMPILQRNGSQAKQKKGIIINGRKLMLLGHCFDKKGVHINHRRHLPPSRSLSQRIDRSEEEVEMDLEESRKSIEVFGSGAAAATLKGEVAKNMERKLSMLTWDAIPKPQSIVPASRNGDDVASDASSDLFEIENISGPTAAADDDDAASSFCTTPASRYAPSEASIQWSVVTATVASDFNDDAAGISSSSKEAHKGRHGGILGCRSRKAMDVAQNVASKNQDKGKLLPALIMKI